jgi:hypothetical protein
VGQLLLATVIAIAAVVLWCRLRAPGWHALRTRPLAAGGALACVGILSLALSSTLIDVARGHDDGIHQEGADGFIGALYEVPPGETTERPQTVRLPLRTLHGKAEPYTVVARGSLTLDTLHSVGYFHARDTRLVDASGRRVTGCDDAAVDAFTMPQPPDTVGEDAWGLTVQFPPGCGVSSGTYQESNPMPEPEALAALRP